jgi:hypothetical protein
MSTCSLPSSSDGKHRCDNCGKTWKADELEGIKDLDNRVDAGSVVPSGQCPECGALCYPVEPDSSELLNACREIMKYVDRNGTPVNKDDIRVILPSDLLRRVRRLIDAATKK